jgi:cytochrome c556
MSLVSLVVVALVLLLSALGVLAVVAGAMKADREAALKRIGGDA